MVSKRCFDVLASILGLLVLFPVFIIITLLIKVTSRSTVFYSHRRVGCKGKEINVYKFRTMMENAEDYMKNFTEEQIEEYKQNYKLKNDPRVTAIGRFLRKTSLDEIPQLFNVLIGNMSIVGPRPVTEEELEKYGKDIDTLLSVKPGITGMWQVNGRSISTYNERVNLDIYYIKNANLILDLKIILKTLPKVIKREGAY